MARSAHAIGSPQDPEYCRVLFFVDRTPLNLTGSYKPEEMVLALMIKNI
jgi:hypothetical protein